MADVAYKSWRWDKTDWYTGKHYARVGKLMTCPDWNSGMPPGHCGNGWHSQSTPSKCFKFVSLGPISEVELIGEVVRGQKIRSEKIRVIRWLSDDELAVAARKRSTFAAVGR